MAGVDEVVEVVDDNVDVVIFENFVDAARLHDHFGSKNEVANLNFKKVTTVATTTTTTTISTHRPQSCFLRYYRMFQKKL